MASHLFFWVVNSNSFMNIDFFVILKFFWDIWFESQFGLYLFQVGSSVGELGETERVLRRRLKVRSLETDITTNLLTPVYKNL